MARLSRILLRILTNSFVVSVSCLLIGFITPEGSLAQNVFGMIGVYGIVATFWIFIFHALSVILKFILRDK